MNPVLYRTTAKCATQCTDKIFFAPIATSNTAYLFATRLVSPNTTNQCRGEIFFARIANHYHRIPCSQPDPSAPTPPTNVGAKYFSPESQTINTSHPVHNPTSQPQRHQSMEGRNIFRPNRNQQHRIPIRNPTRQPHHHQSMYWRNIFRPNRNQQHRLPCSQRDPSVPTPSANVRAKNISPLQHTTDLPYPGNDPTIVPNTASHRRRAMCWGCVATPGATHLPCQINLNHNWR